MKRAFLLLLLWLSLVSFSHAETKLFKYAYLGNFKGLINVPKLPGKLPVIIYAYDEFYDWAGKTISYSSGYNLHKFAEVFSSWGYITVIPIERYRKVNAILGAYEYLKDHPKADLNNVHFIGLSEGAFMGLIAYQNQRNFKSLTLIAPITINDKGYLSLHNFRYNFSNETVPILFFEVTDAGWRINSQREVMSNLLQYFSSINYYTYNFKKRYFWDSRFSYMDTIQQFLIKHYN